MAGTATKSAEELAQAYDQAISTNFAAVNAGMAQTMAAVKMFTDSLQAERDEAGKVWEQTAGYARSRSEKMAGFFRELGRYARFRRALPSAPKRKSPSAS